MALFVKLWEVVGWCEGIMYLTSLGRPTDTGLQLARPAILVAGKGRGGCFHFFSFLLSFLFLFLPYSSLSSPLLSFLSLFSLSLGDDQKWPTRIDVSLNPNTIVKVWVLNLYNRRITSSDHAEQICIVSKWLVENSKRSCVYKVSIPILTGPGKNLVNKVKKVDRN